MNNVRNVQALNKRELETCVAPSASWHADYRHTAHIFVGGIPLELNEGDVVTIFSQYGEPTFIKLARDRETGKSRGFGWLKYADQRSTDLAVDNLSGAEVLGRKLNVDHAVYKKPRGKGGEEIEKDEGVIDLSKEYEISDAEENNLSEDSAGNQAERKKRKRKRELEDARPQLKEEVELAKLLERHEDEDPMKEYLVKEKREEVVEAIKRWEADHNKERHPDKDTGRHPHRHRHHHSSRATEGDNHTHRRRHRHRSHMDEPRSASPRRSRRASDHDSHAREKADHRHRSSRHASRSRSPHQSSRHLDRDEDAPQRSRKQYSASRSPDPRLEEDQVKRRDRDGTRRAGSRH